jgi:hypothetical protein
MVQYIWEVGGLAGFISNGIQQLRSACLADSLILIETLALLFW